MALDYFVLWVNAEAPYKDAREYLDAVGKEPGRFMMGGTGTNQEDQIITVAMMLGAFGRMLTNSSIKPLITKGQWPAIVASITAGIAAATGARFSLLPPENASGNFVKVVQRVPVRIAIDSVDGDGAPQRLPVGLSVNARVRVH